MKTDIKNLIESYQKKIDTLTTMIGEIDAESQASGYEVNETNRNRYVTKRSDYRTFVVELEKTLKP